MSYESEEFNKIMAQHFEEECKRLRAQNMDILSIALDLCRRAMELEYDGSDGGKAREHGAECAKRLKEIMGVKQ